MNNRKRLINKLKHDELMKLKREQPIAYTCRLFSEVLGVTIAEAATSIQRRLSRNETIN